MLYSNQATALVYVMVIQYKRPIGDIHLLSTASLYCSTCLDRVLPYRSLMILCLLTGLVFESYDPPIPARPGPGELPEVAHAMTPLFFFCFKVFGMTLLYCQFS